MSGFRAACEAFEALPLSVVFAGAAAVLVVTALAPHAAEWAREIGRHVKEGRMR